MKPAPYRHTFTNNVLGEVHFSLPWQFTFVYPDGTREVFCGVTKLTAMRTGCYVLTCGTRVIVVSPGHRYVIEEPM